MLGDGLINRLNELGSCSSNPRDAKSAQNIIKEAALQDFKEAFPEEVDSNIIIEKYRKILKENEEKLPSFLVELSVSLPNQKKYEIIVRNVFTSNAKRKTSLANNEHIIYRTEMNETRYGKKHIYKWKGI